MKRKISREVQIDCLGYSLFADFYQGKTENPEQIILCLMGSGSNKENQKPMVEAIVERTDAAVLVPDYSGHGKSDTFDLNEITPAQHIIEVEQIYAWIQRNFPKTEISLVAMSYGGFLAAALTLNPDLKIKKMILRAPAIYPEYALFQSWRQLVDSQGEANPEIDAYRNDPEALSENFVFQRAKKYQSETLVIIHELDEVIPTATTDAYIQGFSASKYIAKSFKHTIGEIPFTPEQIEDYNQSICNWINK